MLSRTAAAIALAATVLVAACGGGSEPAAQRPESAAVSPAMAADTTQTFTGARSNYLIVQTGSGWKVTDLANGGTSTTLPTTTTALKFTDYTVNLGIGAKSQTISDADLKSISELYVAFFNRVPDADGLAFWIDQFKSGMTLSQMCDNFYAAAVQYSSLTGYSATMSNADFVTVIYKNVLGRTSVDAGGMQYWTTALANGSATRGTLVSSILTSAHSFKGDSTWGWVADLLDNKYSVARYFAVQQGLNYNSPSASISGTMAIAGAVTSTGTTAAIQLIGFSDTSFTTLPLVTAIAPSQAAAVSLVNLAGNSASSLQQVGSVDSFGSAFVYAPFPTYFGTGTISQTVQCSMIYPGGTGSVSITYKYTGAGSPATYSIAYSHCQLPIAGETYMFDGTINGSYAWTSASNYSVTYSFNLSYSETGLYNFSGSFSESATCTALNSALTCSYNVGSVAVANAQVSFGASGTAVVSGIVYTDQQVHANGLTVTYSGWTYDPTSGRATSGSVTVVDASGNKATIVATASGYTVTVTYNGATYQYTVPAT